MNKSLVLIATAVSCEE